ncbi:hypothetical protein [Flavobacterium sp. N1994]|uniref:hypothetical protein n=1 Tax=Flavobacterium sp. N1994 TaxID=2986827 RepID=UPI0022239418|nr:hypothetical protein [Flavobacterium sp. N1994]
MNESILLLEERNEFDKAFEAYQKLYSNQNLDFELWKHFFFFLWICIEDSPLEFQERIDISKELKEKFVEGKKNFSELAEFNFIAGYTVSIFPYEFGDYDDLENEGSKMILKATEIEPENIIYRMVYLGDLPNLDRKKYEEAVVSAKPIVLEKFNGIGFFNKYFRQVLARKV